MTAHRDFDAAPVDVQDEQEVSCTFSLGGRTWRCRPAGQVPWNLVQRVFSQGDSADEVFIEVERFFRGVLIGDDIDPFIAMLDDPNSALTEGKVVPVVDYVCGEVLGRPTKPSAGSGTSPRRRSSKERSSSPDTQRIASVG